MVKNEALPENRLTAVETGGCPHAAIREVKKLHCVVSKTGENENKMSHWRNGSKISIAKSWKEAQSIHDLSLSWIGTDTSIKSGSVKLVLLS